MGTTWSAISQLWLRPIAWLKRVLGFQSEIDEPNTTEDRDHALFKDYTDFQAFATSYARYPKLRVVYHPHAHADKLKEIADLPLLVSIHGLGGSLSQFAPVMGSLINIGPIFGLELPGHGLSDFEPQTYEAYSFEALLELWKVAIEDVCQRMGHRKVVLVSHSLGCSIAASLAVSTTSSKLDVDVVGIIAVCPKAHPPSRAQVSQYRRLLSLPDIILDIVRWFDRRGSEESRSVKRFVGETAGIDLKRLQLRFNKQFTTKVWKRTSIGLLPTYGQSEASGKGGLPGKELWEKVDVPLLLVAGESDTVTKAQEAADIAAFIQHRTADRAQSEQPLPLTDGRSAIRHSHADDEQFGVQPSSIEVKTKHAAALKFVVLPAPASHALMYDHSTYRTVAGLIEDFLAKHVSPQLSLGWQLQQLTTSGKWDVKNLQKWKRVLPVSGPIDHGFFRALKTLREQDEEHSPAVFLREWKDKIFAVIDISHDSPVYDTKALEQGGVQYHKFPTVSKVPPTLVEVQDFIALVDRLREEIDENFPGEQRKPAIAVHCHYGYNRTGFFIVCYLIEKRGWRVQDAIEEFAQAKPPGIKHDHFIDTLFVRYCVGLRRSSTFK